MCKFPVSPSVSIRGWQVTGASAYSIIENANHRLRLFCPTALSAITVATFLFWPTLEKRYGWKDSALPICLADALGLAAFAVLGTQKGVQMGLHPIMWVVCGLMSACFGGITRDVLCAQPPRVMYHSRSMYAQAPLLGSILYTILTRYCKWIDTQIVASLSFLLAFITRVVFFNNPSWKMPHWKQSDK